MTMRNVLMDTLIGIGVILRTVRLMMKTRSQHHPLLHPLPHRLPSLMTLSLRTILDGRKIDIEVKMKVEVEVVVK